LKLTAKYRIASYSIKLEFNSSSTKTVTHRIDDAGNYSCQ